MKTLDKKYKKILYAIIEEYIESKNPIASEYLVNKKKLDCCSATVRNIMLELDEAGYLYQPYISAGRIPTNLAYRLYVNDLNYEQKLSKKIETKLESFLNTLTINDVSQKSKFLAKFYTDISKNAILLCFSPYNYYITGFSDVLSQPEFYEFEKLQNLSLVFDNLESICESLFENVKNTEISIGVEGSFSENLSSIKSRFSHGVITIIGPTRMDYKQNLALINYFKNKIGD
ncbi:MAG TPA: hypothetical protein PLD95_01695 [bacterium]|nr:hypothetical protein [bacterium]HOG38162.1 hypothetical protein [bacterium]